jgi:imidazolonepropionase-like amidohydrolase
MSHALNDRSVRIALDNGVKSIEHGNLMEESTIRHIGEKGAWLCTQVFSGIDFPFNDLERKQKFEHAMRGIDQVLNWARKYGINLVWGSDIIFIEKNGKEQINSLLNLLKWFSPTEILLMVTGKAGELLNLSGDRNPYKKPLGVIKEGAYADLILWKNNPLENFSDIEDPDRNILLLMKNGVIIKNILGSS